MIKYNLIIANHLRILFFLLLLYSCSGGVQPLDPSSYLGKRVPLPEEVRGMSDAPSRIIVYLDLGDCASCALKPLKFMEDDLTLFQKLNEDRDCLDIIFVITGDRDEQAELALASLSCYYPVKVFYDDGGKFLRRFPQPVEPQYRCYLFDDTGTIRLIGFPYMNETLKEKYVSHIF